MSKPMNLFDNYEIHPCTRTEEPDSPGKFYFEQCEPEEADVWTLYGHIDGEGVEAIGDFTTREHAEEVFFRIVGIPFTHSKDVKARLRIQKAAPNLLAALQAILPYAENEAHSLEVLKDEIDEAEAVRAWEAVEKARAIIAEAMEKAA